MFLLSVLAIVAIWLIYFVYTRNLLRLFYCFKNTPGPIALPIIGNTYDNFGLNSSGNCLAIEYRNFHLIFTKFIREILQFPFTINSFRWVREILGFLRNVCGFNKSRRCNGNVIKKKITEKQYFLYIFAHSHRLYCLAQK